MHEGSAGCKAFVFKRKSTYGRPFHAGIHVEAYLSTPILPKASNRILPSVGGGHRSRREPKANENCEWSIKASAVDLLSTCFRPHTFHLRIHSLSPATSYAKLSQPRLHQLAKEVYCDGRKGKELERGNIQTRLIEGQISQECDNTSLSYGNDMGRIAVDFQRVPNEPLATNMPLSCFKNSPASTTSPGLYTPVDNEGWNFFDDRCTKDFAAAESPHDVSSASTSPTINRIPFVHQWNEGGDVQTSRNMASTPDTSQYSNCRTQPENLQAVAQTNPNTWVWQSSLSILPPSLCPPISDISTSLTKSANKSTYGGTRASAQETKSKRIASPPRINKKSIFKTKPSLQDARKRSSRSSQSSIAPRLRTAEPTRRSSSISTKSSEAPDAAAMDKSRSHNEVEKQYRQRLNGHFAALLDRIPRDVIDTAGNGEEGCSIRGRNVSKAETLILAERYIRRLQEGEKELGVHNIRLRSELKTFRDEWVGAGGVVLP